MRHTLRVVGGTEDLILGFRRVPNPDACDLCKLVAGRRYLTHELLPIHTRCRCSVAVVTRENRAEFFGKRDNDLDLVVTPDGLQPATVEHGEVGSLLVDGSDHFTQIAA